MSQWDFLEFENQWTGFGTKLQETITRPGKRLQKTMERSTIFNGKIHYFYGHFQ